MPIQRLLSLTATVFSVSLLLSGCTASESNTEYQPDRTYRFTLLHTNDHHSHFWQNHDSQSGMSSRKLMIDDIRSEVEAEGGTVLLFSGGDIHSRTSRQGIEHAKADLEEMNLLGYDAMTVGRHEFGYPLDVLRHQQEQANFPFLSANIFSSETGYPLFDAYKLVNLDGLSLAIFGLTSTANITTDRKGFTRGIDIRSPMATAEALVPQLRQQADIVIATSNLWNCHKNRDTAATVSQEALSEAVEGIDIILGGYFQAGQPGTVAHSDTLIFRVRDRGREMGRADFEFKNGELTLTSYQLLTIGG